MREKSRGQKQLEAITAGAFFLTFGAAMAAVTIQRGVLFGWVLVFVMFWVASLFLQGDV